MDEITCKEERDETTGDGPAPMPASISVTVKTEPQDEPYDAFTDNSFILTNEPQEDSENAITVKQESHERDQDASTHWQNTVAANIESGLDGPAGKRFSCSGCQRMFAKRRQLHKHHCVMEVQGKSPVLKSCDTGRKTFKGKPGYSYHRRVHAGEKPYSCDTCGKAFVSRAHLEKHQRIHSGEKPFPCLLCGKSFNNKANCIRHSRIHTNEKPFNCELCGKAFTQKGALADHQRLHRGEKPFVCNICNRSFTQKSNMKVHARRVHAHNTLPRKREFCDKQNQCSQTFTELDAHKCTSVKKKKSLLCRVCGEAFDNAASLRSHQQIHIDVRVIACEICSKAFSHPSQLEVHVRKHTNERPFGCEVCGKAFKQRVHANIHQARHFRKPNRVGFVLDATTHDAAGVKQESLDWDVGSYMCMDGNGLRLLKDKNDEGYLCDICGMVVVNRSAFQRHLVTHTGKGQFVCSVCRKAFVREQQLIAHSLIHDADKKSSRAQTFGRPSKLSSHAPREDR